MLQKNLLRKKYYSLRKKKYYEINKEFFNPFLELIKLKFKKKKIKLALYYPSSFEIDVLKLLEINYISNQNLLKLVFSYIYETEEQQKGILLCKLKQQETLKCNIHLNIGNGEKHSRWSVVSPCTYSFKLDKNLINDILTKKCTETNLIDDRLKNNIGEDNYGIVKDFITLRYTDLFTFRLNPVSPSFTVKEVEANVGPPSSTLVTVTVIS